MVLTVENLIKDFNKGFFRKKVNILKDISFKVCRREVFGIVGPNGAGKTTTFKCILGFIKPNSGNIQIFGHSNSDYTVKSKIGYLPENPFFYEYLTGYELLKYMGMLHGMRGKELKKQIEFLLERVNLTNSSNIQLRKYSKGMLQRIAIAQSIINDPELLILDEPMSGLDALGRREIRDLILELKQQGKTVILSSHVLADLEVLCDRICFIFDGKVITTGTMYELLNISDSEYEAVLRKREGSLITFRESVYTVSEESDKYISIKFNHKEKNHVLEKILSNNMELISIHPLRQSLEYLFEKQLDESRSENHQ